MKKAAKILGGCMGLIKTVLFIYIVLFIYSCSDPKKDYEPLQQLQSSASQNLKFVQ